MNHQAMEERCPGARFMGPSCLKEYMLVFDGQSLVRPGGTANIVHTPESKVWGALYEITEAELAALDAFERYPTSYQRKDVLVIDLNHKRYSAIAYYRTEKEPSLPGESYLKELIQGAIDSELPEEYVRSLKDTAVC